MDYLSQIDALKREMNRTAELYSADQRGDQAAAAADMPAILEEVRHKAQQFLAGLQLHRQEELDMVLESVTTDIGVSD
jgi:hypothetical protein